MSDSHTLNAVPVLLIGSGTGQTYVGKQPEFAWERAGTGESIAQPLLTRKAGLQEGLKALQSGSFDLVLLDLSSPGTPVSEWVARTVLMAKRVPVIALVSAGREIMGKEAVALGAQTFAWKDCPCDSLVRFMENAVGRRRLLAEIEDDRARMAQARQDLTAHLSHELRNALACIHQFGNILNDGLAGPMPDEQREYVGIMLQNASRIRGVVDSLLEADSAAVDRRGSTTGVHEVQLAR